MSGGCLIRRNAISYLYTLTEARPVWLSEKATIHRLFTANRFSSLAGAVVSRTQLTAGYRADIGRPGMQRLWIYQSSPDWSEHHLRSQVSGYKIDSGDGIPPQSETAVKADDAYTTQSGR